MFILKYCSRIVLKRYYIILLCITINIIVIRTYITLRVGGEKRIVFGKKERNTRLSSAQSVHIYNILYSTYQYNHCTHI